MELPPDVWELILAWGGPLRLCRLVCADRFRVAALRLQRRARQRFLFLKEGELVEIKLSCWARVWWPGCVFRVGNVWAVRVFSPSPTPKRYIFLSHPTLCVRRASVIK